MAAACPQLSGQRDTSTRFDNHLVRCSDSIRNGGRGARRLTRGQRTLATA